MGRKWSCFSYAGGRIIWTVIQEVFSQVQLYQGNWEVQQPQCQNLQIRGFDEMGLLMTSEEQDDC